MTKVSAIKWLRDNLTEWKPGKAPNGYWWVNAHGSLMCISKGAPDCNIITKSDWSVQ